jgi:DNA-binding transcriptional ArsR family regulator
MDEAQLVRVLAALAQPLRLRVFHALADAGSQGLVPSALCDTLHIQPPTLSFHLKELMLAQLVTQQRRGRFLVYRACTPTLDDVLEHLATLRCAVEQGSLPDLPASDEAAPISRAVRSQLVGHPD